MDQVNEIEQTAEQMLKEHDAVFQNFLKQSDIIQSMGDEIVHHRVCFEGPVFDLKAAISW